MHIMGCDSEQLCIFSMIDTTFLSLKIIFALHSTKLDIVHFFGVQHDVHNGKLSLALLIVHFLLGLT